MTVYFHHFKYNYLWRRPNTFEREYWDNFTLFRKRKLNDPSSIDSVFSTGKPDCADFCDSRETQNRSYTTIGWTIQKRSYLCRHSGSTNSTLLKSYCSTFVQWHTCACRAQRIPFTWYKRWKGRTTQGSDLGTLTN